MAAKKKTPPASTNNGEPVTAPTAEERRLPKMTKAQLERQVHVLEEQVARLKAELEEVRGPQVPWWQKITGSFANDPAFDEAMRLGREWRESFRPKPRKKARKAKSSDDHS
jgi:hypothetical protein